MVALGGYPPATLVEVQWLREGDGGGGCSGRANPTLNQHHSSKWHTLGTLDKSARKGGQHMVRRHSSLAPKSESSWGGWYGSIRTPQVSKPVIVLFCCKGCLDVTLGRP